MDELTKPATYVYLLEATGRDGLTGNTQRTITNRIAFTTREGAEHRIDRFRQACIETRKLDGDQPIEVEIVPLEVIE